MRYTTPSRGGSADSIVKVEERDMSLNSNEMKLNPEQLREHCDTDLRWGSHPEHTFRAWQDEVRAANTRIGYWEWVASKIHAATSATDADARLSTTLTSLTLHRPMRLKGFVVEIVADGGSAALDLYTRAEIRAALHGTRLVIGDVQRFSDRGEHYHATVDNGDLMIEVRKTTAADIIRRCPRLVAHLVVYLNEPPSKAAQAILDAARGLANWCHCILVGHEMDPRSALKAFLRDRHGIYRQRQDAYQKAMSLVKRERDGLKDELYTV